MKEIDAAYLIISIVGSLDAKSSSMYSKWYANLISAATPRYVSIPTLEMDEQRNCEHDAWIDPPFGRALKELKPEHNFISAVSAILHDVQYLDDFAMSEILVHLYGPIPRARIDISVSNSKIGTWKQSVYYRNGNIPTTVTAKTARIAAEYLDRTFGHLNDISIRHRYTIPITPLIDISRALNT